MRMSTETNADGKETRRDMEAPPYTEYSESHVTKVAATDPLKAKHQIVDKRRSNRRWRWRYFPRALQPISETAENIKEASVTDSDNENTCETDESTSNQTLPDYDLGNANTNVKNQEDLTNNTAIIPGFKDDYSACNRLIEKFQEAVIDSAVRIIQAYFKRFYQRKKFLRLKKAVSVIQRSLRNWLQKRKFRHKTQEQNCVDQILKNSSDCIQDVSSNNEFQEEVTANDLTKDNSVDQEDFHSAEEELDHTGHCDDQSNNYSECDRCGKDDRNDDDSDYGSGEIDCVCLVCGESGCYPSTNESDIPSSEHLSCGDSFVAS